MPITDQELEALFRVPDAKGLGIELTVNVGRRLDVGEVAMHLEQLRRCRSYIHAVTAFARWLAAPTPAEGPIGSEEAMKRFLAAIRGELAGTAETALDVLAAELGALHFYDAGHGDVLHFDFEGGFHLNPTYLGFLALGATLPLTILAIVFGAVQIQKTNTEADCLAHATQMGSLQIRMLEKAHRREGKLTPELVDALKIVNDAAVAATNRCGSTLSDFTLKVTIPPRFSFEIQAGRPDNAYRR